MTEVLQPGSSLRVPGTGATPSRVDLGEAGLGGADLGAEGLDGAGLGGAAESVAGLGGVGEERALTRREMRARERELAALETREVPESHVEASEIQEASEIPSAPETNVASVRMPPLGPTARAHAHIARRRGPSWATKAFSLGAMLAVAGMAVATSVPANALMSSADVAAARLMNATNGSLRANAQTLHGDSVGPADVPREGFASVSAAVAYGFSHARHDNSTFSNNPAGSIQWPFPFGVPISDYFGPRVAPTEGASTFHQGVDFDPGSGTPIQTIADGVVRVIDPYDNNGLGVHVIIDHLLGGKLVSSVYGHLQVGSIQVVPGQKLKVGDIVGLVGNTGVSTGAHLHFEIRLGGSQAVDPYAWLKANAN